MALATKVTIKAISFLWDGIITTYFTEDDYAPEVNGDMPSEKVVSIMELDGGRFVVRLHESVSEIVYGVPFRALRIEEQYEDDSLPF